MKLLAAKLYGTGLSHGLDLLRGIAQGKQNIFRIPAHRGCPLGGNLTHGIHHNGAGGHGNLIAVFVDHFFHKAVGDCLLVLCHFTEVIQADGTWSAPERWVVVDEVDAVKAFMLDSDQRPLGSPWVWENESV